MDSSPRSPMTSSMAESPTRGGNTMEEGSAPGPPVGGGAPYNPYPLGGGSGAGGYVGYYMGPPHGMGAGIPHGGYSMPYGGPVGPVGATNVGPPPPHLGYAMHPHPQAPYGSRGMQGPPGAPTGMPSPYGRSYGMYEYYGAGPGGQPMKSHQQAAQQPAQERSSPSSPSSKSTRGGFHGISPRSTKEAPSSGSKSSPLAAESRTDESSPLRPMSSKSADDLDVDRAKSAAEAELTPSVVKPLQSDFHFFVLAVKDRLRLEAEREVTFSLKKSSKIAPDSLQLQYLINTNLNARLMKEWEDMKMDDKEVYLKNEEEDRKRFMEEDEVASRHCATLTARVKSPGDNVGGGKDSSPGRKKYAGKNKTSKFDFAEGGDESYSDAEDDTDLQIQATESQDDDDEAVEVGIEREPKRSTGETDEADQSPSKKNRVDSEEKSDEER